VKGASLLILDDGLQSPALAYDFSFAVVDGAVGIGNGLCIPAGPLRAPVEAQMARVSAVVIVGEGRAGDRIAELAQGEGKPVLGAMLRPDERVASILAGRKVLAFAGIGLPRKFFATLASIGAEVVGECPFPDHYRYTGETIRHLQLMAARRNALLVTTEKDIARLRSLSGKFAPDLPAPLALPVSLEFDVNILGSILRQGLDRSPRKQETRFSE
jgi:tetraacyldisaccharide 4'-kinase